MCDKQQREKGNGKGNAIYITLSVYVSQLLQGKNQYTVVFRYGTERERERERNSIATTKFGLKGRGTPSLCLSLSLGNGQNEQRERYEKQYLSTQQAPSLSLSRPLSLSIAKLKGTQASQIMKNGHRFISGTKARLL